MIASLSIGVPTIVCGWSHKYFEVLKEFGLEQYVFDYRDISTNIFVDKFEILSKNKSKIKLILKKNIDKAKKSALVNFLEIKNLLEV